MRIFSVQLEQFKMVTPSRWHGKGLLRLAGGGEVAGVWKSGKREGKATITSPTNGIVSLVGEYRSAVQDDGWLSTLFQGRQDEWVWTSDLGGWKSFGGEAEGRMPTWSCQVGIHHYLTSPF